MEKKSEKTSQKKTHNESTWKEGAKEVAETGIIHLLSHGIFGKIGGVVSALLHVGTLNPDEDEWLREHSGVDLSKIQPKSKL